MYVHIIHQPVAVSSNTYSKVCVDKKHFLAHLQVLIPTLASKSFRCAREWFISTCTWLHIMFELTVTVWWIIGTYIA